MSENEILDRRLDLLLKGGHVIDPANQIDGARDVGLADGQIARVAAGIPADRARQVIDVSGLYVVPGIIDLHAHVYPFVPTENSYVGGMNADAHLPASGVTTAVDAGTVGWRDFAPFKAQYIDTAKTRILAFINLASSGMIDKTTEQDLACLQPALVAALAGAYPEIIVGIKSAHYWTHEPWDDAHPPWASVDRAVEAGELCGKPVMVDFWPRPPERSYRDLILKHLRPGDIHTHVFAQQFPIVDGEGHLNDDLLRARERGVIFDLGHGAASFWFRNAVPAIRGGFMPDSISTDLHMANVNGPVIDMLNVMSKCLGTGMPLTEVIARSTMAPANEIGRPDLGSLRVGAAADVAVLRQREGDFAYTDCGRAKMYARQKLDCMLTIRGGEILYDPTGLGMPEWTQAPAAYWKVPRLQDEDA